PNVSASPVVQQNGQPTGQQPSQSPAQFQPQSLGQTTTSQSGPAQQPPGQGQLPGQPQPVPGQQPPVQQQHQPQAPGQNGVQPQNQPAAAEPEKEPLKKPWEYSDEIMSGLKTAFPLLALSMETMVDQIHKNFKCPPDEDAYRLIVALLNDGL